MTTRRARPTAASRGFTLLEILIVMGVLLILMSLVLGVGSALLKRAERSQVETAMAIMESAFNEWEAQAGRPVSYNGTFNSLTAPTTEVFITGSSVEVFDVREPITPGPPAPGNTGNRLILARARGAGVYAVNLLAQLDAVRPILAGIAPSILRPEPNASTYPGANVSTAGTLYLPSAKSQVTSSTSSRSELVDTWGNRIAFVFPGRAFRFGVDAGLPDADGTVRTPAENLLGVCTNRRICLVSAGPDGLFGVSGEVSPDNAETRAAAAADNISLYELDPPN